MAEPDYIDEDNPELIRPQKLINPVKSSRNHQDLHRELRMNQKSLLKLLSADAIEKGIVSNNCKATTVFGNAGLSEQDMM